MSSRNLRKVKIIGGGASGLFAAYHLKKLGHNVEIFERSNRLGGLIQTFHLDWGVVETAANGVLNSRRLEALAQDIGIEWVPAQKKHKKRFIYRGKPKQFPLSFFESWDLLKRVFSKIAPNPRENLRDYVTRVYGPIPAQYIVEPGVLGVFGAESRELSATLIYNYFFKSPKDPVEQKSRRGTVAPVDGMAGLIVGLESWLKKNGVQIHLSKAIKDLKAERDQNPDDVYLIATDAHIAGALLENLEPATSSLLKNIEYKPLTTVTLAYEQPTPLKGFGCLFPRDQGFNAYGVLWNTCIFANRGPNSTETWILPDGESSADTILEKIKADSRRLYKKDFTIQNSVVTIWPQALPLYSPSLEEDLKLISLPSGLYLMGNYLGQIGLSKIFEKSFYLAEQIHNETLGEGN